MQPNRNKLPTTEVVGLGNPRVTKMQAHPADQCRTNALHCVDVAEHACTPVDRSDFLAFAESWRRLADEIDYSNRLIAFIDGLAGSNPTTANTQPEELESGVRSLKRLTAAIVAISSSLMAGQLDADSQVGSMACPEPSSPLPGRSLP
jgi:hypothetical protein